MGTHWPACMSVVPGLITNVTQLYFIVALCVITRICGLSKDDPLK